MPDSPTRQVLLEAVRADVRRRVDDIVDDLERDLEFGAADGRREGAALKVALTRVTEVMAEGIVVHLRETRRGGGLPRWQG